MFTITSLLVRARNSVISTCSHDSSLNDHQRSPTPPYEIPEEVIEVEEFEPAVVTHSNSSTSDSSHELPYEPPFILHFPPPPSYPPPPIPPNTPRRVRFSFDPPETPPLAEPEASLESSPQLFHHPLNLFSIRDVIESDESGVEAESAYGDSFDSSSDAEEIYVTAPGTPDSGSFMENVTKEVAMEKYNILLKELSFACLYCFKTIFVFAMRHFFLCFVFPRHLS
uniref:Uncharacterized protein n=1 Tax=Panagrolaimus sp. PS1159 TaxID=55785 RepID=A0AC35G2Z1_9BILA